MSADTCPYCARNPTHGQGPTADHVFVAALGGRSRVRACRDCNSTIGNTVEGPLLRPGTFLNLVAQVRGAGHALPGTLPDDQVVTYDLKTHELRSVKPVSATREGDTQSIELRGSPRQVRRLLAQQNITGPDADALIATAGRIDLTDMRITTTVKVDLPLSDRLAAKVALGSGELAFGGTFAVSPLGVALRSILWEHTTAPSHISHDAAAAYDDMIATTAPDAPHVPLAAGPDSQTVFLPVGADRTGVLVHLAGTALGAGGLVLDAPLNAGYGLPVLVLDRLGGPIISQIATALTRPSDATS